MEVRHDGGKVWLDGIEGFSPAEFASSVHGSQARILEAVGESMNYDDLICYSGFAFRVGLSDRMCPSAGHPCCGYNCMEPGLPSLPWRMKAYESFPWEEEKSNRAEFQARVNEAVRTSIDRGIPVHYGSEEDGLIIGYEDDGKRWLCLHPYHKWGAEPFWHDEATGFAGGKWPWGVVTWEEPKSEDELLPERELLTSALSQAVEMWSAVKQEDQYFCGAEAYENWIGWLTGVGGGTVEDPKSGMQGNGWCYDVLVHSRQVASRWLRKQAESLEGETKSSLLQAADNYDEIVAVLMRDLECSWTLALPAEKFDEWTEAMREDEIGRLRKARELDGKAVDALTRAVDLLEAQ